MYNKESNSSKTTPNTATIGGRIKALRMKKGMSQEALAALLTTDKSVISRLENNRRGFDREMAERIAAFFEVSPDYIVFGNDHRENNEYQYVGDLTFWQREIMQKIADEFRKSC